MNKQTQILTASMLQNSGVFLAFLVHPLAVQTVVPD